MKVLFTGLGSIGSRHLKNLAQLCNEQQYNLEVTALRATDRPLPDDLLPLVDSEVRRLQPEDRFDIAFITGPTHLHAATIGLLEGKADCFFIEKPIFECADYQPEALGLGEGQKAYVAAPMRWCGAYMALKEALAGQTPLCARAICSSYLPGWRPGTDYRAVYSAKADMGGGVALDLVHEWDYLVDLFGFPQQSCMLAGKFSQLEIDSNDLAVYIARYPGLLAELHLDYFGRTRRRTAEVMTDAGSFVADFESGALTLPDGDVQSCAEDVNARYLREMAYFIDYARTGAGPSVNPPAHALAVLRLALGVQP